MKGDNSVQMGTLRHPQTNSHEGPKNEGEKEIQLQMHSPESLLEKLGGGGQNWGWPLNGMKTMSLTKRKGEKGGHGQTGWRKRA